MNMKKFLAAGGLLLSLSQVTLAQETNPDFKPYKQNIPGTPLEMTMVPIPAGSFLMGSPDAEKNRQPDEGPQQKVQLSAFWMASFELSRDIFDVYFKDANTSQNSKVDAVTRPSAQYIDLTWGMGKEGGFPVNSMSQFTALMFCRWLYEKTGIFYRLPTEAEWEYACKAGSTTSYYYGDDPKQLGDYAWFKGNSKNKFQKSGQKKPNAWGLYDMLGNVSEWTLDHYQEDRLQQLTGEPQDPRVAVNPVKYPKVLKGGGYTDLEPALRCSDRQQSDPSWNKRDPQIPKSRWWLTDAASVGFRVVRPLQQPTKEEAAAFFKEILGN
jgi:formylglycine-generating enzyme required for sulfatase activity